MLLSIAPLSNADPASGTSRQVLESLPADIDADGGRRSIYEVALVPCDDAACPFEVRLVARTSEAEPLEGRAKWGVERHGPVRLTWYASGAPASGADAQTHTAEPIAFFGAALPRVWTTGLEEDQVAVSAGAVPLEPGKQTGAYALLVTQTAGFEHPKRQHALLTAVSGDLKVAWSKVEPQGPHVSWVAIPKRHAPVYVSLFFSPDDDAADDVLARQLKWDTEQQVFSEEPPPPQVQAVVAGSYRTLSAARVARSASDCLTGYSAIDTGPNQWAVPHRYALIRVTWEPAQVATETERLRQCRPGGPAHSLPLTNLLSSSPSNP
ncbi:hypothetical protein VC279_06200 [Xanthomonas sp. WHRI 10064A]|uniref:hypothetical protein n=1 Tax=unclassified Xanthomonas TaxID=2643310 RepID=UPI002B229E37|nr:MULTISPECIES: hypothetical protein [unclassified Xanthomonas]MEA9585903.1 hypothetical protein [Xanthomonas sp. WHRI 10064B]MEA9614330.1 hypothetical protein [Xanthomonas sp. WHRI 10064A]